MDLSLRKTDLQDALAAAQAVLPGHEVERREAAGQVVAREREAERRRDRWYQLAQVSEEVNGRQRCAG